jgi:hypothetical protein
MSPPYADRLHYERSCLLCQRRGHYRDWHSRLAGAILGMVIDPTGDVARDPLRRACHYVPASASSCRRASAKQFAFLARDRDEFVNTTDVLALC